MLKLVASYFSLELLLVVAAVSVTLWRQKKRLKSKHQNPQKGFVRTDETFIDPTTGIKQQVWFNPQTGERFYETSNE